MGDCRRKRTAKCLIGGRKFDSNAEDIVEKGRFTGGGVIWAVHRAALLGAGNRA